MNLSDIIKRITGPHRLKPDELKKLDSFLDGFDEDKEVQEYLEHNWKRAAHNMPEASQITPMRKTEQAKLMIGHKKRAYIFLLPKIAIAASVATILGIVLHLTFPISTDKSLTQDQSAKTTEQDKVQSVILLQGNRHYNLSTNNIHIKDSCNTVIGTHRDLKLMANNSKRPEILDQQWSTLRVPRGKDYHVILHDSTEVWMNACSELSFPDYFINGKREVTLKGEAYFIVKSDKNNPFFVKTSSATVEVTGTKFNIYSYPEEPNSLITLVEGKVAVAVAGMRHTIVPGQQLVQDAHGQVQINDVNPYLFIAWKDGVFEFHDMTLHDMSLRLMKWYNVEFVFASNQVANQRFTGMVKKEQTIAYFIKILEKTTSLRFSYKDSVIAVYEK